MWGKVVFRGLLQFLMRITPTHVGKSDGTSKNGKEFQDHPHPCGEKMFLSLA